MDHVVTDWNVVTPTALFFLFVLFVFGFMHADGQKKNWGVRDQVKGGKREEMEIRTLGGGNKMKTNACREKNRGLSR